MKQGVRYQLTGHCDEGNGTGEKAIYDIIRFDLMEGIERQIALHLVS